MSPIQNPSPQAASKASRYALAVLLLTSVHHAYGAFVYATPWRYHAVLVSAATAVLILGAQRLMRVRPTGPARTVAHCLFLSAILIIPVATIGVFEGFYNHVLKNILYFGGVSSALLARLFPPPTYELPNDVFFEITGILQVVPAALAAWSLYVMTRSRRASGRAAFGSGSIVETRELRTITGERVSIPEPGRLVHLQFRRFAGCPVCNLHLRSFVRRHEEIAAAGIREVVVFHSTRDELLRYEGDLPFAVIADPARRLYADFGVEASPRALLDPRAWLPIVRAVLYSLWQIVCERRPVPPIRPKGGSLGLPADFLIAGDGRVLACNYGVHADDQWSVDALLQLALDGRARESAVA